MPQTSMVNGPSTEHHRSISGDSPDYENSSELSDWEANVKRSLSMRIDDTHSLLGLDDGAESVFSLGDDAKETTPETKSLSSAESGYVAFPSSRNKASRQLSSREYPFKPKSLELQLEQEAGKEATTSLEANAGDNVNSDQIIKNNRSRSTPRSIRAKNSSPSEASGQLGQDKVDQEASRELLFISDQRCQFLKRRNLELEEEAASALTSVRRLEMQMESLNHLNAAESERANRAEREVDASRKEMLELSSELSMKAKELSNLSKEIATLRESSMEKERTLLQELESAKADLHDDEVEALRYENEVLREKCKAADSRVGGIESAHMIEDGAQAELLQLKGEVDRLLQITKEQEDTIENKSREIDALSEAIIDTEERCSVLEEQSRNAREALAIAEDEHDELQNSVEDLRTQLEGETSEKNHFVSLVSTLRDEKETWTEQEKMLRIRVEKLETLLAVLKESRDKDIADMRTKAEKEASAAQIQIHSLQEEHDEMRKEYEQLRNEKLVLEEKNESLAAQLSVVRRELLEELTQEKTSLEDLLPKKQSMDISRDNIIADFSESAVAFFSPMGDDNEDVLVSATKQTSVNNSAFTSLREVKKDLLQTLSPNLQDPSSSSLALTDRAVFLESSESYRSRLTRLRAKAEYASIIKEHRDEMQHLFARHEEQMKRLSDEEIKRQLETQLAKKVRELETKKIAELERVKGEAKRMHQDLEDDVMSKTGVAANRGDLLTTSTITESNSQLVEMRHRDEIRAMREAFEEEKRAALTSVQSECNEVFNRASTPKSSRAKKTLDSPDLGPDAALSSVTKPSAAVSPPRRNECSGHT